MAGFIIAAGHDPIEVEEKAVQHDQEARQPGGLGGREQKCLGQSAIANCGRRYPHDPDDDHRPTGKALGSDHEPRAVIGILGFGLGMTAQDLPEPQQQHTNRHQYREVQNGNRAGRVALIGRDRAQHQAKPVDHPQQVDLAAPFPTCSGRQVQNTANVIRGAKQPVAQPARHENAEAQHRQLINDHLRAQAQNTGIIQRLDQRKDPDQRGDDLPEGNHKIQHTPRRSTGMFSHLAPGLHHPAPSAQKQGKGDDHKQQQYRDIAGKFAALRLGTQRADHAGPGQRQGLAEIIERFAPQHGVQRRRAKPGQRIGLTGAQQAVDLANQRIGPRPGQLRILRRSLRLHQLAG
ncbi:MAG: hypothetical protein P8X66_07345 [Maritimibacter sp.]